MEKKTNFQLLEQEKISRLLIKFCIPSLAGSLTTSIYNIVDQLFIGNAIGMLGNAATNVVFPATTMITALSLMCGVGASARMNLAMGKGDVDTAKKTVGSGFVLMILCGLIMTFILLVWTRPVLYLFGCTDAVYIYAEGYAKILAIAFVFAIIGAAGPFLIRADGSPAYALVCIVVGAGLNVVLDAVFIYALDWGIRGAAWATVISQIVSALMILLYLRRFHSFSLKWKHFIPDRRLFGKIAVLGTGPAFNFLTQVLVQIFLNNALRTYGDVSVYGSEITLAAAGVANKVNTISVGVVTGLTNGMQPIISYNYGKKNYERIIRTAKSVIGIVLLVGFGIFLCYQLIPVQITALFGDGSELYFEFAARFFRIYLMLICLNGLQSSVCGFFSAQGHPGKSILISLTRQVIFLPPLLIILPRMFGLTGALVSGPVADLAMAILAWGLLRREFKSLRDAKRHII